uniref:CBS domain-containing protein n=1 Tax=Strongyloides papillosus TaxID=174720 RepID=A0A0N5BDI0_STREA
MTKIEDVLMLPETMVLNPNTVTKIVNTGYTRIPVYRDNDKNNVVSLLFIKDLALVDPDENFTVKTVCTHHHHVLRFIYEDTPLKTMLEEFKKGDYHLAMVKKRNSDRGIGELCGLVTLEDILEEILKAEIIDETDVVIDNVHKIRRKTRNKNYLSNCYRKNVNKEAKTSKSNTSLPAKTTKKS